RRRRKGQINGACPAPQSGPTAVVGDGKFGGIGARHCKPGKVECAPANCHSLKVARLSNRNSSEIYALRCTSDLCTAPSQAHSLRIQEPAAGEVRDHRRAHGAGRAGAKSYVRGALSSRRETPRATVVRNRKRAEGSKSKSLRTGVNVGEGQGLWCRGRVIYTRSEIEQRGRRAHRCHARSRKADHLWTAAV